MKPTVFLLSFMRWLIKICGHKKSQRFLRIQDKLLKFELNVASTGKVSPRDFIKNLTLKLDHIDNKIKKHIKKSFFDTRLPDLKSTLQACRETISRLTLDIIASEQSAHIITQTCQEITEEITDIYGDKFDRARKYHLGSLFRPHSPRSLLSPFSIFEKTKTAGSTVWFSVQSRLIQPSTLTSGIDLADVVHNTLAHLILSTDTNFIEQINMGALTLEGEIGHLIIQRLKSIIRSSSPPVETAAQKHLKDQAGKILYRAMDTSESESILKCDYSSLLIEITKLVLHAKLHPHKKIFWLGTARAVDITLRTQAGEGTYLNCDDKKWTWQLNRLWLQAAIHLGYSCKLVEQHYPSVEKAILSQNASFFVRQLLYATRKQGEQNTSQYNGNDAPTATAQEMLVLMDLGCYASKNEEQSIIFSRAGVREEPSSAAFDHISPRNSFDELYDLDGLDNEIPDAPARQRAYSAGDGRASPALPYPADKRVFQFFIPKASKKIRSTNTTQTSQINNITL
jgi:hypothetical protein